MRHPPIQPTRKLSAVLNVFQVLYNEGPYSRPVHLVQGIKHQALALRVSVFLPLDVFSDHSSIGKNHPVLVVAVHAKNSSLLSKSRSWFFKNQIDEQSFIFEAETNRLTNRPAIFELVVQMLGRFYRDCKSWGPRASKVYCIIEGTFKLLDFHEVIIKCSRVFSQSWLSVIHSVSNSFFRLLGQGLGESCRGLKFISTFVNGFKVGHFRSLVPSLPEKIYKVLSKVVAFIEEGFKSFCLGLVQVREKDTRRASHSWGLEFRVGFNHSLAYNTLICEDIKR